MQQQHDTTETFPSHFTREEAEARLKAAGFTIVNAARPKNIIAARGGDAHIIRPTPEVLYRASAVLALVKG